MRFTCASFVGPCRWIASASERAVASESLTPARSTYSKVTRRFVRATIKSWEEAKNNPGAAVDAALKVKPDLNRQSTLEQLQVDIELLDSPNSKGRIGWGAQADWDQTLDLLKKYRDLKTTEPWTAFHTNEFVVAK